MATTKTTKPINLHSVQLYYLWNFKEQDYLRVEIFILSVFHFMCRIEKVDEEQQYKMLLHALAGVIFILHVIIMMIMRGCIVHNAPKWKLTYLPVQ